MVFVVIDVLKVIALVHNSNVMVHLNVQISQMKTIVNINMTTALVVLNVLKDIAYLQIGGVMEQPTAQGCVFNNFSLDKHRHQICDDFLFQF